MDHFFKKSVIEKLGLPTLWDIVEANPDKPWDYGQLSINPNITWDIVEANPDKRWNYSWLSANPNITWEIIQANPDKPWKYSCLSRNPNITWEIVEANPDKPWDYFYLSENKLYYDDIVFAKIYRQLLLPILDKIPQLIPDLANIVASYI